MSLWPATENEIVDDYEVACNEFQPCGGYDVIKLSITKLTSVSKQLLLEMHSHHITINRYGRNFITRPLNSCLDRFYIMISGKLVMNQCHVQHNNKLVPVLAL